MLSRLSPAFGFPGHAASSPTAAAAAAAAAAAEGEGLDSPFGTAELQGEGAVGVGEDAVAAGFDPAAVAAAAAAAAVGKSLPSETDLEQQRSLTKLMGAMYQKQLQRHLERASSRRSNPRPRRLGSGTASSSAGSQDLSGHSTARAAGRKPLLASLTEEEQQQQQQQQQGGEEERVEGWEHPAAVETCPAAVGKAWLPQLMQQLGPPSGAPTLRQQPGSSGVAAGAGLQAAAGPSNVPVSRSRSSSGSPGLAPVSSHPTLAQVRSLFDAGTAEDAEPAGQRPQ